MNQDSSKPSSLKPTTENLSQAIFIVNRHAKTAPNPRYLYQLKAKALKKLLIEGKAKKVGLHFSANPKYSQQQSDVLIVCGDYSFHLPPSKDDIHSLPHLGKLDQYVRNPKATLSLSQAKRLLISYTGFKENHSGTFSSKKNHYSKPVFKKLGESYF